MARTKQTARKTTGGKAPRKMLATQGPTNRVLPLFSSNPAVSAPEQSPSEKSVVIDDQTCSSSGSIPSNTSPAK